MVSGLHKSTAFVQYDNYDHADISSDLVDNNSGGNFVYSDMIKSIPKSIVVHLIEQDIGLRANIARRLFALGFHAEIYATTQEFAQFSPKDGIILIDDANHPGGLVGMVSDLAGNAGAMPVVVFCAQPTITGVVSAMKARAANYLSLEVPDAVLFAAIDEAYREGEQKRSHLTQMSNCGKMIDHLSQRERQVLEMLVEGESNKGMARSLGLSPRTVEIHRMKLMGKLGARTSAQAVKIWCAANMAS